MHQKVLRVSHIASMAWCQVKAKALLQGAEPPSTPRSIEGIALHEELGFNDNLPVSVDYGGYEIVGHVDRLVSSGSRRTVFELKTSDGSYPLNFLLAPAHVQANLYAWMCGAQCYVILVYFADRGSFWGLSCPADAGRALEDLDKAIALYEGRSEPIPTEYAWKCSACFLAEGGMCGAGAKRVLPLTGGARG